MRFIDIVDEPTLAILTAAAKHRCLAFLLLNTDRVRHFARRIDELGRTPAEVMIVVINADDLGGSIALEHLMPGHDWDAIRATGAVPVGRGLVERAGVQALLEEFDPPEADRLKRIVGPAILVVDQGVMLAVGMGALGEAPT